MARLSIEICRRLREVRREKGLKQSILAAELGFKQSALSMFESGNPTKLSDEAAEKLAARLGVSLEAEKRGAEAGEGAFSSTCASAVVRGYCPNGHCPSNLPYVVDGEVRFLPVRALASPCGGVRCALCGEVLEQKCGVCGAPLNDGACCGVCGNPYVAFVLPEGTDAAAWAAKRRAETGEIRSFL